MLRFSDQVGDFEAGAWLVGSPFGSRLPQIV